ncbi:MAG: DUF1553 domain-containing protein, partial [Planctomycetota bacterium]
SARAGFDVSVGSELSAVKPMVAAELVDVVDDDAHTKEPLSAASTEPTLGGASRSSDLGESREVIAPPVQLAKGATSREAYSAEKLQIRILTGLVLAISACLAYVVIGMPGLSTEDGAGNRDEVAEVGDSGDPVDSNESTAVPKIESTTGALVENGNGELKVSPREDRPGNRNTGTPLDLDDLPFDERPETAIAENRPADSAAPTKVVTAMSSVEVVTQIDSGMRAIWDSLGIEPAGALDFDSRVAKISETLVGKSGNGSVDENRLAEAIDSQVRSNGFANHWASEITSDWLKRSALPTDAPVVKSLRRYLARSIRSGAAWNEVVGEVLGGDIRFDQNDTTKSTPAGVLAASWGGNSNHRFASRIGAQFLDSSMSCSRCHDAKAVGGASASGSLFASQSSYHQTLGLLSGIESSGNGYQGGRSVKDNQSPVSRGKLPELFYEQLDGRMAAVKPSLPGTVGFELSNQDSPRKQFAKWVASSERLDRATVNNTWRLVFGRYLVPQVAGVDVAALEARGEVLDLLQRQFVAHDRNIGQLVSWLVQTEAFGLGAVGINETTWASASNEQLETMQLKEIAFAARQSLGRSPEARNVERAIQFVVDLDSSKLEQMRTLAQANPTGMSDKKAAKPKNASAKSASYLLYGLLPTAAEEQYLSEVQKNDQMDWNLKVEHVSMLSPFEVGNSKSQDAANKLREHYNGDEQKTLRTLLWSVKNAAAF